MYFFYISKQCLLFIRILVYQSKNTSVDYVMNFLQQNEMTYDEVHEQFN